MLKKKVLITSVLLLSVFLLTGVSGLAQTQKTEITAWVFGYPNFMAAYDKLIPLFEKEHPDIQVNRIDMSWGELGQKVITGFVTGGNLPDLMEVPTGFVTTFIKMKMFAPTPEWVMAQDEIEEKCWPTTIDLIREEGIYYGMPHTFCTDINGFIYNKKIWQEVGVDPADCDTWENTMKVFQKLTIIDSSEKITRAGLITFHENELIPGWALQYGGKVLSDEGDKIYMNTPAGKKALQTYKDLFFHWKVADPRITRDAFTKGQVTAVMIGPYYGKVLDQEYPSLEWGFFPVTSVTDRPPYFINSENWVREVPKSSQKKEAAFTWIKFMTEPDNAITWALTTGEFPPIKSACYDERIANNPALGPLLPTLPYAVSIDIRNDSAYKEVWKEITDKLVFGKIEIDEAAAQVEKKVNEIWAQYDALYE